MNDIVTQAIAVCSLITGGAAVIGLIVQAAHKAKEPNEVQNKRITDCEFRIAECEKKLAKDLDRFEDIEDGTAVMMTAMLALLSHGIDGNDVEGMKDARDELQSYLIKGRVKKKGESR